MKTDQPEMMLELSVRERQVLSLAARGETDQGIANRLGISPATVNSYWVRIRLKMGQSSRTELVARAVADQYRRTIEQLRLENQRLRALITDQDGHDLEPLYREIFSLAPDGILLVSKDGIILDCNDAMSQMFGYDRAQFVGMGLEAFVPTRLRAEHAVERRRYLEHPTRKKMGDHFGTAGLHRDGHEFSIAATLAAIPFRGSTAVICMVRDLSQELELLLSQHDPEAVDA
ncbi:MAG TPA: PAS domain S-box protein [Fimbriimonadaceae bacterium]|nr:PAS domain S-box protein [Fimbriimonadaceae bacterium]